MTIFSLVLTDITLEKRLQLECNFMVRCAHFEVKFRFRAKIQSPTPFYLLIHWFVCTYEVYVD